MSVMASQITSLMLMVTQMFIQPQIKENIQVPHHWRLCRECTGEQLNSRTKG